MARVRQEVMAMHEDRAEYGTAYEPFVPGPNPKLAEFVKQHSTPYDAGKDRYDVRAFDRDLVVDKAAKPKAIYDMHTYWSKKHWAAIREYIQHYLPVKYYPKGTGLVLDCFSGSGTVAVSSKVLGRHYIAIEQEEAFVRDWIIPRLAQAVIFTPEVMQRALPFDPHALNFGAEDEALREVGITEAYEAAGRVDAPDDGGSDDEESEIPTPGCHPDEKKQPRNPSIFD